MVNQVNRIILSGEKNEIINELSNFMSNDNANLFINNIEKFNGLLSEDEWIKTEVNYPNIPEGRFGFMICEYKYHINFKIVTLVIIATLLDITLKVPWATLTLTLLGINLQAFYKLDDFERCFVIATLNRKEGIPSNTNFEFCTRNVKDCQYKCNSQCRISNQEKEEKLRELVKKNILVYKNGNYMYNKFFTI